MINLNIEQQQSLNITPILPRKQQIKQIQLNYQEQTINQFKLFMSINKKFLFNLIQRKQIMQQAKKMNKQGLVYFKNLELQNFKFDISLIDSPPYDLILEIMIYYKKTLRKYTQTDCFLHYNKNSAYWTSQTLIIKSDQNQKIHKFSIKIQNINEFIEFGNIFIESQFKFKQKKYSKNQKRFCGLRNVGNTCYMNSFLQSLYFIRPLRKSILDLNSQNNQCIKSMQKVFSKMMKQDGQHVDPKDIILNNSWTRNFLFQQQDINQFKFRLFEEFEKQDKNILKLLQGEAKSVVRCKDVKYESITKIQFNEIELDIVKNTLILKNIIQSLNYQLEEETLQKQVDTEKYGMHLGYKKLNYVKIPEILFLNLKRYQYIKQQGIFQKRTSKFQYSKQINLDFLTNSKNMLYTLYAVLVHRGLQANQGHYYSYINVSNVSNKFQWYKFNDTDVYQVEEDQVYQSNYGGIKNCFRFDRLKQGFSKKNQKKDTTAYILIYIKTSQFQRNQSVIAGIPEWIIQEERKTKSRLSPNNSVAEKLTLVLADDLIDNVKSIFSNQCLHKGRKIQIQLKKTIEQQYKNIKKCFGQTVQGTLWRVSIKKKSVFNLRRQYQGKYLSAKSMLYGDNNSGQYQNFYILFVPEKLNKINRDLLNKFEKSNKLGLLCWITFWQQKNEKIYQLTNMNVVNGEQKQELENLLMGEEQHNKLIWQNNNIISQGFVNFKHKNMYCFVIKSYFEIKQLDFNF